MAIIANTFTSYDAIGIREDLANVIYDISKEETPFMSNISSESVTNTTFEWQTDVLATANGANAAIDGNDVTAFTAVVPTTRPSNKTQIATKTFIIADNLAFQDLAGRSSEVAYQITKNGKELKRDIEAILTYNIIPTAGSNVLARRTGGLSAWLATNSVSNTGGAVAGANPVAVAGIPTVAQVEGTKRAITEPLLQDVVQNCWTNGGAPSMVLCGAHNKQAISAFTGIAEQRYSAPSAATTIIGAADIYVSDFGQLSIVPDRFIPTRNVFVIDPEYAGVGILRDIQVEELAKTGDASKHLMLWEGGLVMKNEAAHGAIYDCTTA
tara:strand:+ start:2794 stop:3768 length:975 start_codon:yes stop_codon:yes gene_type:complete